MNDSVAEESSCTTDNLSTLLIRSNEREVVCSSFASVELLRLSKASIEGLFVVVAASFNGDVSDGSVSMLSLTSSCCCIGASVAGVVNSLMGS